MRNSRLDPRPEAAAAPGGEGARPQVKILIAAWGERYVSQLERFGLASFLAPGNLPALASRCGVEIVLLTSGADVGRFESSPMVARARAHAGIRYVPIDDLIAPGCYSTTLTLAFMRGIALYGERMTGLHFVFWNADFVMSDGGFAHLAGLIEAGRRVVVAGSLRATAELAEPRLDAMRGDPDAPLAASPRALAGLALRYQHPHHFAKTVNQDLCWTTMPSQMLWRVDSQTVLARFFKAFMLCLAPTRQVTAIEGPCDYAFVPELCPGEPQTLIEDSDEAFILELQPRASEQEFIRMGTADEDVRRACMAEWLTEEHLDTGRRVVTIHSGDLSDAALEPARAAFADHFRSFMAEVPPPASHVGQYYWTFGAAAWRRLREAERPGEPAPPELVPTLAVADLRHPSYEPRHAREALAREAAPSGVAERLRWWAFGRPHEPRRLHPDAPATSFLAAAAARTRAAAFPDGPMIVVGDVGSWVDLALPLDDRRAYRFEPDAASFWSLRPPPLAAAALVCVRPQHGLDLDGLLDRLAGGLADGARVSLLLHDAGWRGPPDWMEAQLRAGAALFGRLDGAQIFLLEASAGERRYAERFAAALGHGASGRRLQMMGGLAAALLGRAVDLGSREPSGRPVAALITGRLGAEQPASAAAAAEGRPASGSRAALAAPEPALALRSAASPEPSRLPPPAAAC